MTANELVAFHYEKRADRLASQGYGASAWFFRQWAVKARSGKKNQFVYRVEQFMQNSC